MLEYTLFVGATAAIQLAYLRAGESITGRFGVQFWRRWIIAADIDEDNSTIRRMRSVIRQTKGCLASINSSVGGFYVLHHG